jgi:ABC-type multidrug transport system ATPase subunit
MKAAIDVEGLTKPYQRGRNGPKSIPAVNTIDLQVRPAEIFGLLEP